MAKGSQEENGKIALLVIKATKNITAVKYNIESNDKYGEVEKEIITTIEIIKKQSPKRFIITVKIPEVIVILD
jgi:HJR/Mrr/RecB family endonuclease